MTKPKLAGLRSVLDRRNWQHLEETAPDVADEIEKAVVRASAWRRGGCNNMGCWAADGHAMAKCACGGSIPPTPP